MLTPCWPSAGPIGGAGLALPAATCSFMYPLIFFAMVREPKSQVVGENGSSSVHDLLFTITAFHSSSANVTFSTSRKFNSTGVDRPKIVTVTFNVDLSSLTSSTLPVKLWKGPDLMRTVSPAAYENFGFGFSAAAAC